MHHGLFPPPPPCAAHCNVKLQALCPRLTDTLTSLHRLPGTQNGVVTMALRKTLDCRGASATQYYMYSYSGLQQTPDTSAYDLAARDRLSRLSCWLSL